MILYTNKSFNSTKDKTIIIPYAPYNRGPKYMKQQLTEFKEEVIL